MTSQAHSKYRTVQSIIQGSFFARLLVLVIFFVPMLFVKFWEWWHFVPSQKILRGGRRFKRWLAIDVVGYRPVTEPAGLAGDSQTEVSRDTER